MRYGVRDYRFRVAVRCFCPPDIVAPVVIRVSRHQLLVDSRIAETFNRT